MDVANQNERVNTADTEEDVALSPNDEIRRVSASISDIRKEIRIVLESVESSKFVWDECELLQPSSSTS